MKRKERPKALATVITGKWDIPFGELNEHLPKLSALYSLKPLQPWDFGGELEACRCSLEARKVRKWALSQKL